MRTSAHIVLLLFLSFLALVGFFGGSVYYFLNKYSYNDLYKRLETRARIAAEHHYGTDTLQAERLLRAKEAYLEKLPEEQEFLVEPSDGKELKALAEHTRIPLDLFRQITTNGIVPKGASGPQLDALARAPLWAEGVEYGHGTGHGVGYFLAVHEGPQSISKAIPDAHMAMEPAMITSIEPGVYRAGQWGVRIENLVLNVPVATAEGATFAEFLEFDTLTMCPIDTRCIEPSLLRDDERAWLNDYARVRATLAPRVSGESLAWLIERTEPI